MSSKVIDDESPATGRTWIFQVNPKNFNIDAAVTKLREMTWLVSAHKKRISRDDTVLLWKSGAEAGVFGKATVFAAPFLGESLKEEKEFELNKDKFKGLRLLVRLRIDEIFAPPLSRSTMKADVRLAELSILKFAEGTNFVVTADQAVVIDELLETHHGGI